MNREISFRIFDKCHNKMITSAFDLEGFNIFISPFTGNLEFFERPKNIYRHQDADSIALVHWIKPIRIRENSGDLVLMQFTGLLDKNGVKIFEGDIVISDGYPWFDTDKPNYRDTVEWCFAGFHTVHHCVNKSKQGISDGINTTLEDGAEWEVIGNIFESPELLEEK